MFDIDKLFLNVLNYKVNREEGEDGKFHQTVTSEFKEGTDEYYQNRLLQDYLTLLLDWESHGNKTPRSVNILHRSIDNDTSLIKNIIKDIEQNSPAVREEPYGFYSLSTQTRAKNDYITGKVGIGPFALNNNNHVLTMLYHVKFKHIKSSLMNELGLERLDLKNDQNGESIMSWISALINAHVDIAKDPYISRLNVNPFTYNLVNLLVRTGLGSKTFYFTSQPIMKALAAAYINAGSMYMADPYASKYRLQRDAIDAVVKEWFEDSGITFEGRSAKDLIKAIKEGGKSNAKLREKVNARIHEIFINDLEYDAKSPDVNLERQLFMYLAYLQFEPYSTALSSLVKYSKIDTKKHGKSVVEQKVYREGFNQVFSDRESSLFEYEGLRRMKNRSYIGVKTDNAISVVSNILSDQFLQSSPVFDTAIDNVLQSIGRAGSLQPTLVGKISDAISASVKSRFFSEEYVPTITDNPHFMHDLVSESSDTVDFAIYENGNAAKVTGKHYHDLSSYTGGTVIIQYMGADGKYYYETAKIVSADDETNTVYLNKNYTSRYGKLYLKGGKNTIYDRFMRLQIAIHTDPRYSNLLNSKGEISNRVLSMLVPGNTYEYTNRRVNGEQPDTYETAKFVKFFNFVEDSSTTSNYIIEAWDDLLNYKNAQHPEVEKEIKDFARDLIVYGFMTSGDKAGFTKIFKYVPTSWREQSGYGNYIAKKLIDFNIGTEDPSIDVSDIILNNWFDNDFVPTYKLYDKKTKTSNFVEYKTRLNGKPTGFATILAAIKKDGDNYVASIDPENAPLYIKVARNNADYNSQRRYTIYKMHNLAISKEGVLYPVYVKVNPKGLQTSNNFLITEYGRDDGYTAQREYEINEDVLKSVYQASDLGNHIQMVKASAPEYASIMSGLGRFFERSGDRIEEESTEDVESGESTETTEIANPADGESNENNSSNEFDDSGFSDEAMKHCKS